MIEKLRIRDIVQGPALRWCVASMLVSGIGLAQEEGGPPPSTEAAPAASTTSSPQPPGDVPAAQASAPSGSAVAETVPPSSDTGVPQAVPQLLSAPGASDAPAAKSSPPESEDSGTSELESPVEVHGFVSQGFIKSTGNNYLVNSKRGSFEFSELGINFTKEISDKFRVGAQLFARNLGRIGNYSAQFDWAYLDYRFFDWLGVRVGRTKLPFGLYNETSDIDAARVPILLPQALYPIQNRDYLLAQTGGEVYGFVSLEGAGDLEYRLYGGTLHYDTRYEGSDETLKNVSAPYVVGGRLMWQTPFTGLQFGGSVQALRLDLEYVPPEEALAPLKDAGAIPKDFSGKVSARLPVVLAVGSLEYTSGDLLVAAEYSRWRGHIDSSLPALLPNTIVVNERFYGMASYRLARWLAPGGYYSAFFPDAGHRSGRANHQHDFAATLRFDVNTHWLVKLEGHFIRGTATLSPELNDGAPLDSLSRDWLLFLAKTTAYF